MPSLYHNSRHLAQLAALTQRDHSQSPSSVARLRRCCCQSLVWKPGRWCQGAAHCLECSVLYGHPSGYEAGVPVWTQCSAKMDKDCCHLCHKNAEHWTPPVRPRKSGKVLQICPQYWCGTPLTLNFPTQGASMVAPQTTYFNKGWTWPL